MRKQLVAFAAFSFAALFATAQSKIFKEVSDEIRSQVQPIRQDQSVVGYLALTQLEKASADSFNYRISIMDENLNDIGKVEFRERNLDLQDVSFEQDVICLGYFRNITGSKYKNKKDFEAAKRTEPNNVFLQFLTLDGKILNSVSLKTEVEVEHYMGYSQIVARLTHRVQLTNVPQKGFVCFFQDDANGKMNVFDTKGNQLWHKETAGKNGGDFALASGEDVYLLSKRDRTGEGGWEVKGYNFSNGTEYDKIDLRDKKGNGLYVTGWGNHPVTGKPYVSGLILNPGRKGVTMIKDVTKGPYFGVFSMDIAGHSHKEVKETYSYWNDGSQTGFSEKGRIEESKIYPYFDHSFKDLTGNTVFVGASVKRKPRWGAIAASVVLAPTLIVPIAVAAGGFTKCSVSDNTVLTQSPTGNLNLQEPIPSNSDYTTFGSDAMRAKTVYRITNTDSKTEYLVMDETKDVVIYNLTNKKLMRTIPHYDGISTKGIIPAKDGHIMVVEYNKKEKYTRVSIEQI